jgi:large subunit ribosomal protein L21
VYAVIKAGGHQYKVQEGDKLLIDYQEGEVGKALSFDQVLMVGGGDVKVGKPFVTGASVDAVITSQTRAKKVIVFNFRRRKDSKKKRGHKQCLTEIEVKGIKS